MVGCIAVVFLMCLDFRGASSSFVFAADWDTECKGILEVGGRAQSVSLGLVYVIVFEIIMPISGT